MKSKAMFLLLVAIVAIGTPSTFAATNFVANGVTWKVGYEGDYLPNDSQSLPGWTTWYTNGGASWLSGASTLVISNWGNAPQAFAEMDNLSWWNASTPSTVEVSAKFTPYDGDLYSIGELGLINGSKYFHLVFWDRYLKFDDTSNFSMDTTNGFHTYRVTLSNNVARLYVDNSPIEALASAGVDVSANRIFFGDASTGGGAMSEWDYVRWTNDGSFIPVSVPEPTSLALVGLGAMAGLCWYRKRTV